MQLISNFNQKIHFLLCVIDIFSKYAWVISLEDKKIIIVINAFQKMLKKSNGKPNKYGQIKASNVIIDNEIMIGKSCHRNAFNT